MLCALDCSPPKGNTTLAGTFPSHPLLEQNIFLVLLLLWCCQTQFLQRHWLLTLEYSAFIRVCPSVRMLCDTESSPAPNDVETGGIYCPSNQNHEAQLPLEHNLLSIITTSISLVCHVHCSAVTVPWNSCSRKLLFFFFPLSKCLHTYFTFHKNNSKKEEIQDRFRKQTLPYSVSIVLLLHTKNSARLLLAKFLTKSSVTQQFWQWWQCQGLNSCI